MSEIIFYGTNSSFHLKGVVSGGTIHYYTADDDTEISPFSSHAKIHGKY